MRSHILALTLLTLSTGTLAATVACPDMKSAVRAGVCPTEEELLFHLQRLLQRQRPPLRQGHGGLHRLSGLPEDEERRAVESRDGEFQGYVSCEMPESQLKALKPTAIAANKEMTGGRGSERSINRLMCSYGEGIVFSRRSREECRVEAAEACRTDAAACKADCASK